MRSFLLIITAVFMFLFSSIVSAESRSDTQREYPIVQVASIDRLVMKLVMSTQIQKKKKVKSKPKTPVTSVKPVSKAKPAPSTTLAITKTTNTSYTVPGGSAAVGFSVTARDGIIVSASSTTQAGGTSRSYQEVFASGLTQAVVGKKTAGLSLSAIGGASLTTSAFTRFVASNF